MKYYAHSTGDESRADWQVLCEHLNNTAERAEQFGDRFGIGKAARLAGLLHDLGKYDQRFQARLAGAKERVDHSTAGAAVVTQLAKGDDKVVAELIAYGIAGRQAGLPDKHGASSSTLDERLKAFSQATLDLLGHRKSSPRRVASCRTFAGGAMTRLVSRFNWRFSDVRGRGSKLFYRALVDDGQVSPASRGRGSKQLRRVHTAHRIHGRPLHAGVAPSHVLRGIGLSAAEAECSIRFCVGRQTTDGDVHEAVRLITTAALAKAVAGVEVV